MNGSAKKAFASGVVVAFLLCGVFGGLVVEQSLGYTSVVIWDDSPSYWSVGAYCTVVDDMQVRYSGVLSCEVNTTAADANFYRAVTNQNWSDYEWISFWWFGNGSGASLEVGLYGDGWDNKIVDNFVDVTAFLLGVFFKMGKWGFVIGLAVGAGLGYAFIANFPLWLLVLVAVGEAGLVYSTVSREA